MSSAEPIRLLVVHGDEETAAALKSLLRGRIERPYTIDLAAEIPPPGQQQYDVLVLEFDAEHEWVEKTVIARIRRALAGGGAPPLVLLGGTRNRALEPVLITAGAVNFIWKEELAAPLLESQIRHALDARQHALLARQFHEAQRMETIGRLAGGVAHDFNNILTAIIGFGSLVAEQVRGDDSAEANVAEILQAAERASVLTRQLLAFGRRQVLHPARMQLEEAVEGVTSLIARLIGEDIDLKITYAPQLPPVRADRAQIESAVLNLVMNARDAMPGGGRLTIELSEASIDEAYCTTRVEIVPGHYVRLAISDTGQGIPAYAQERIFEPFFTRDGSRTGGLGLAAVYGIVKQSGGHILVYSEEGIGTTFRLYLPVDTATDAETEQHAPANEDISGSETILLVEDADGIRRLAAEVIRRAGYRVLEASNPTDALEVAEAHRGDVHLLLTDIVMPGGNGVELAAQLTRGRPRLNVLFMSGYTDDAAIRNGMLAREAAFIQKPFTPQELLRKVKQVLEVGV